MCVKTNIVLSLFFPLWQGHFLLINWLRYILVIETHFVKLIFSFGKFIFLGVFGITTNARQIRYCFSIEETCKNFVLGRLIFGKL